MKGNKEKDPSSQKDGSKKLVQSPESKLTPPLSQYPGANFSTPGKTIDLLKKLEKATKEGSTDDKTSKARPDSHSREFISEEPSSDNDKQPTALSPPKLVMGDRQWEIGMELKSINDAKEKLPHEQQRRKRSKSSPGPIGANKQLKQNESAPGVSQSELKTPVDTDIHPREFFLPGLSRKVPMVVKGEQTTQPHPHFYLDPPMDKAADADQKKSNKSPRAVSDDDDDLIRELKGTELAKKLEGAEDLRKRDKEPGNHHDTHKSDKSVKKEMLLRLMPGIPLPPQPTSLPGRLPTPPPKMKPDRPEPTKQFQQPAAKILKKPITPKELAQDNKPLSDQVLQPQPSVDKKELPASIPSPLSQKSPSKTKTAKAVTVSDSHLKNTSKPKMPEIPEIKISTPSMTELPTLEIPTSKTAEPTEPSKAKPTTSKTKKVTDKHLPNIQKTQSQEATPESKRPMPKPESTQEEMQLPKEEKPTVISERSPPESKKPMPKPESTQEEMQLPKKEKPAAISQSPPPESKKPMPKPESTQEEMQLPKEEKPAAISVWPPPESKKPMPKPESMQEEMQLPKKEKPAAISQSPPPESKKPMPKLESKQEEMQLPKEEKLAAISERPPPDLPVAPKPEISNVLISEVIVPKITEFPKIAFSPYKISEPSKIEPSAPQTTKVPSLPAFGPITTDIPIDQIQISPPSLEPGKQEVQEESEEEKPIKILSATEIQPTPETTLDDIQNEMKDIKKQEEPQTSYGNQGQVSESIQPSLSPTKKESETGLKETRTKPQPQVSITGSQKPQLDNEKKKKLDSLKPGRGLWGSVLSVKSDRSEIVLTPPPGKEGPLAQTKSMKVEVWPKLKKSKSLTDLDKPHPVSHLDKISMLALKTKRTFDALNKKRQERGDLRKVELFGIPEQKPLLDVLLEKDPKTYDFGGFLRQYFSPSLRSLALVNLQGRYRTTENQNCFTSIDVDKLHSKEEEKAAERSLKMSEIEKHLESLRAVANDEDHFLYLKGLSNMQPVTIPITVSHGMLQESVPMMDEIFHFYLDHLGQDHICTIEAGEHFVCHRNRLNMYDNM